MYLKPLPQELGSKLKVHINNTKLNNKLVNECRNIMNDLLKKRGSKIN